MNTHFNLAEDDDAWIWLDYISVPQNHRGDQVLAIASLCAYASLASRFIPLVRNSKEWERLYGEKIRSSASSSASLSFNETTFHSNDEDEDSDEEDPETIATEQVKALLEESDGKRALKFFSTRFCVEVLLLPDCAVKIV